MNTSQSDPLAALRQLEDASLGEEGSAFVWNRAAVWHGFAFSVEELELVVPLAVGVGIAPGRSLLPSPVLPLPLSREWVVGMVNIRGEVHTVIDFARFIGRPAAASTGANLLLLSNDVCKSALLLDNRISLRAFDRDLPEADRATAAPSLAPILSALLLEGDQPWGVIDVESLLSAENFVDIAR